MNIEEEALLIINVIDEMDYFQIMKIDYHSNTDQIHRAYQNSAKIFHPDHFLFHENQKLKDAVNIIAKLITEAYSVLRDDRKRQVYLKQVLSDERKKYLRFHEEIEPFDRNQKILSQQNIAQTELGKKSYTLAFAEFESKHFQKSKQHILSALLYEKDNTLFLQLLEEIENAITKK